MSWTDARKCIECQKNPRKGHAVNAQFCSPACRRAFHNRRAVRGALVYDVLMVASESSDGREALELRKSLDNLMAKWHAEDIAAGRTRTTVPLFEIRYALGDALR